jgi:DNA-binding transcriptional LysR family regulator
VTLRQLRAFVAVAQEQSITRAAQRLHPTASALSMLVSSLEAELAVRLFERTTRRVVLTEEGQALLPSVQTVFKDLDQAFDGLRQLSDRRSGRFAVATSPLLAATLLPALLASFRDRFPGIEVDLLDLPVDGVAKAVREGQADFGVCTADQEMVGMAGMVATTLYQDRLMLACLADHPLAGRKEVRWANLAGEPLALLRHGSGLRTLVERGFAEAGEPLVPAFQVAHVSTAVGLVEAGLAVAILPSYALSRTRSPHVVAVPLTAPVMLRDIVALTDSQRQLTGPCEAFLAHFKSGVTELAGHPLQAKPQAKPRTSKTS